MRTLRAIYNKAIKAGQAEKDGYPFKHYTIKTAKTRKRVISMESIQKIKELKLPKKSALNYDRNVFLTCFYLRGMPYIDLCHLKMSNIIDGRIQYERQKTSQPLDIKIPELLMPLIDFLRKGKKRMNIFST